MARKPIQTPPAADLPENWQSNQRITAAGTPTEAHGYNYLARLINAFLRGIKSINDAFSYVAALVGGKLPAANRPSLLTKTEEMTMTIPAQAWARSSAGWSYGWGFSRQIKSVFVDVADAQNADALFNYGCIDYIAVQGGQVLLWCFKQPPTDTVTVKAVMYYYA